MAKPGKSTLQTAQQDWGRRISDARSKGYPDSSWMGMYTSDMTKVMGGGQPMDDAQFTTGVISAISGKSAVGDPGQQQGLNANPLHDLMVGAKDVGNIIRGFPGGVGHLIAHLPSEVTNTVDLLGHGSDPGWLKAHGYDPAAANNDIGAQARNMANPQTLLQLIPGVSVAGGLSTEQGRQQLSQHPVSAALDVAPLASGAGKLAGLAGRAAGMTPEAGGAAEAFLAGRPYQAAARGASQAVTRATGGAIDPIRGGTLNQRANIVNWAEKMNIDEKARSMFFRPVNQMTGPYKHAFGFTAEGRNMRRLIGDHRRGMLGMAAKMEKNSPGRLDLMARGQHTRTFQNGRMFWQNPDTKATEPMPADMEALASKVDLINAHVNFMHIHDGTAVYAPIGNGEWEPLYVKSTQARNWAKVASAQHDLVQTVAKMENALYDGKKQLPQMAAKARDLMTQITHRADPKTYGAQLDELKNQANKLREVKGSAQAELGNRMMDVYKATRAYHDSLEKSPPQRWMPFAQQKMRDSLKQEGNLVLTQQAANTMSEADIANMMEMLNDKSTPFNELKGLVGDERYNQIVEDSSKFWLDAAHRGFQPIVMHHVDEGEFNRALEMDVVAHRNQTPEWYRKRTLDQTPGITHVAIGASAGASEILGRQALRGVMEQFILPKEHEFVGTRGQLIAEHQHALASAKGKTRRQMDIRGSYAQAVREMEKDYGPIAGSVLDPRKVGMLDFDVGKAGDPSEVMIRKSFLDKRNGAAALADRGEAIGAWSKLPFIGAQDPFMKVFKYSVLTGPRHLVHVTMGGMMMLMLRQPEAPLFLPKAIREYQKGQSYPELRQPLYEFQTHEIQHYAAGKTIGRLFTKYVGSPAHALGRFEERAATILRITAALSKEAKGASREAALREAYRTYIDMNAMTPFERTVIRSVFPFYAFTKHIMRYIMEYPQDHPLRVAMLSVLAQNEIQDYNSGLPTKFAQMFFLGPTDANGNVTSIDYKNINPFRSLANDFTVLGFVSSLNPAITTGLSAMGVNVLGGTPELFPQLAYDPYSGSLVANVPDKLQNALSQFIPEFGAIDHFAQMSNSMRALAKNNPSGYRRQLLSSLNLPFETTSVNLPYERARSAMNEFKVAQQAVAEARKTGDWSRAEQFQNVPFGKGLYDPRQLAALYQRERAGLGPLPAGVSPSAVVPRKPFKPAPLL